MTQLAWTPANPDYQRVVRASFANQGMMTAIAAELVDVAPGRVVIEVPFSSQVAQQQGFFHGAAIGAVGDNAGGYAALSLLPAGSEVVTVEYKINFIRPAAGERLRAEGTVMRLGKSLVVGRVDVSVVTDGAAQLVAALQATFSRVAHGTTS